MEKFKADLGDNLKFIKFRILHSGVSAELDLDNKSRTGIFKSKFLILISNLILNMTIKN